jgi:hypothetical protein
MDHNAIMEKYGSKMKMVGRIPNALAGCMGNQMYVVNLDTKEELDQYFTDLLS